LAVDGKTLTIQYWDPAGAEIIVAFPESVKAGCQMIAWVHVLNPEFVNSVRSIGEQCAPYFGGSQGWIQFPAAIANTQRGVPISVVGAPQIRRFTANGQRLVIAEACTDVTLSWDAALVLCAGSGAQAEVTLLADGNLYAGGLPLTGTMLVSDELTTEYTLRVESFDGATNCASAEQNVTIQRFKALHLDAPGMMGCLDAGDTLSVTARISCPARAGGLLVAFNSSNQGLIANRQLIIPEGSTEDVIDFQMGQGCGVVTLVATAPGHQSAQIERVISDVPQINTITPLELEACKSFELRLDGSCFLVDGTGKAIEAKVLQLTANSRLTVEFPALEAGQYQLGVIFCSKTGFANDLVTIKERAPVIKRFSASPNRIELCPVNISLSWGVESASRIQILRAGILIPGSQRARNQDCGLFEGTFTDPEQQFDEVEYTLEAFTGSGAKVSQFQTTIRTGPRSAFVGLAQIASGSFRYNNTASDPLALCSVKNAVITNVTNRSFFNFSLAHGVAGAPFFILNAGASSNDFNGEPVAGNWTAQLGSRVEDLPSSVTIQVDWKQP
jgi:hypothetical protein